MSYVENYTQSLVLLACCHSGCGVTFGLAKDHSEALRKSHASFYCPNGHGQSFVSETDAERLASELAAERQRKEWAQRDRDEALAARDRAEHSARATRGHLTRARRRAADAVCPVEGCKRSFSAYRGALKRHIATKHPGWAAAAPPLTEPRP